MSCLALSLQPANGSDILLQTREWFPHARALSALSAFRLARLSLSSSSSSKPGSESESDPSSSFFIGDDPLAASSGQLTVGVESKFRIVYRLVNTIYVIGIAAVDSPNIFDTINTVNQAVSVVVAACRGVDVTPEKLHRKYPEVYMALDIVLRGVGSVRLATILSSIHGDSIAKVVHTAIDAEIRARGADTWSGSVESQSLDRKAALDSFSNASFELPAETLAAGDEIAAAIAPPSDEPSAESSTAPGAGQEEATKDPFAASEKINKPPEEELVGGFKKTKEADPAAALAGLDVSTLPPAEATKPTFVGVEGFEGDYGGIEFGNEEATLSEAFEGFDNAFGGGLDASEFINMKKKTAKQQGLGGLEFLTAGGPAPVAAKGDGKTPLENLLVDRKKEMTGPEMFITEEISAEFNESLLVRVAFKGTVYLRTLPPKQADGKETEFSFRVEGTERIKRAALLSSSVSSLGNGIFHVRTAAAKEEAAIPVIKFSLQPKMTPLPLRVRLVKRHVGTLLSVMIQYASNPELPAPLSNVTFVLKLPVDPTLLKVSPKGVLSREEREVRWHVADVPLKGPAGKLRVRMPVDVDSESGDVEVHGRVEFAGQGGLTLSGVHLKPVTEGITHFTVDLHRFESRNYFCLCN